MTRAPATAKLNLALVVGPTRDDRKHEVVTVLQRLDLSDRVAIAPAPRLRIDGFDADTLVRMALESLAEAAGVEPCWHARITKRIPVAAGLGGGSSDAATALRLANATLSEPLAPHRLHELACRIGADVAFFLREGPQLGRGDGSDLEPLDLPQDYWVLLLQPNGATKTSTAEIYRRFDERGGPDGFDARVRELEHALAAVRRPRDLAALPRNDLAHSPLAAELERLGALRADVTGAGPIVYGLFHHRRQAEAAKHALATRARSLVAVPAWYG